MRWDLAVVGSTPYFLTPVKAVASIDMGSNFDKYSSIANIGTVKTTIDISDNLLHRAKDLARREKTTLRELTEEGLRLVLTQRTRRTSAGVKPVIVSGQGLSPEFRGRSWAEIRDEIYRGYGA